MNASSSSQTAAGAAPPPATPPPDRLAGLSPTAADLLRQTGQHLRAGRLPLAEQVLASAEAIAPNHVEVRRTRGLLLNHSGRHAQARDLIRTLLLAHPEDPALLNDLGGALRGCGDYEGAFAAWQRACDLQPDFAIGWFNLARNLKAQAWIEESLPALERTVALAPDNLLARTIYADVLVNLGHLEEARTQYLGVLQRAPATGAAWWGLASIKTVRLSEDETDRLADLLQRTDIPETDRIAMGCTLAKAQEDAGRYEQAFATLSAANSRMRRLQPWSATKFSAIVEQTLATFARPHAHAETETLGEEIIFIVSLPRSGSTLTEQILAAHPQVEGASELPDLASVLREESQRRRVEFPHWVADATPADWTRLGQAYLARTARWRRRRPRSTDKMPNNWFFVARRWRCCPARASSIAGATRSRRAGPATSRCSPTATSSATTSATSPRSGTTTTVRCTNGSNTPLRASAIRSTNSSWPIRKTRSARSSISADCRSTRPACASTKPRAASARQAPARYASRCAATRHAAPTTAACSTRCAMRSRTVAEPTAPTPARRRRHAPPTAHFAPETGVHTAK